MKIWSHHFSLLHQNVQRVAQEHVDHLDHLWTEFQHFILTIDIKVYSLFNVLQRRTCSHSKAASNTTILHFHSSLFSLAVFFHSLKYSLANNNDTISIWTKKQKRQSAHVNNTDISFVLVCKTCQCQNAVKWHGFS